jgi:hypothetical protein
MIECNILTTSQCETCSSFWYVTSISVEKQNHVKTAYHPASAQGGLTAINPSHAPKSSRTITFHPDPNSTLNVANLCLEIIQLLLHSSVLLGHLLELGLPLIAVLLECLYFTFEVTSLDIGLAESETQYNQFVIKGYGDVKMCRNCGNCPLFERGVNSSNLLVVCFAKVLIGFLSFLLQKL